MTDRNSVHWSKVESLVALHPLTLGKVIWCWRKCADLTQKTFSKLVGVTVKRLRGFEKGLELPSELELSRISYELTGDTTTLDRYYLRAKTEHEGRR